MKCPCKVPRTVPGHSRCLLRKTRRPPRSPTSSCPCPAGPSPPPLPADPADGRVAAFTGDLRPASLKVGATPWNHILTLYKQFQKLAMAKLPLEEDLTDEEEGEEEEMEEEDSSFKLCVPVPLQSPLHKTFRPIETVGFVESELKKFLEAQQESRLRLRKMRSLEGLEPLVPSEITLESILGDQGLLLQEMDALGNWPPHLPPRE
ncbi:PREDICTED: gametogenetin-binding protein 1 isoform X1 [Myotis davidii]|uniref:gametogenetin-binding protein 1 isoform X1 n=2 Tax=Myotis davidii TaxID=225400 RepID=UPI00076721C6|nr:PREDICTED: gametogenetin-binding protein 1 isoform X1 [Myotis davidii]